ncbi:hypothetical protein CR513_23824, partial [Mucuna pruriens]
MTRSSTEPLYAFDPEIELTLRRLQKIRNTVVNTSSSSDSVINSNLPSANILVFSSNIFAEPGQMENNDRTLKELATPDVRRPPQAFEGIPCGLLHNEAKGISEDYIKMKAFPFSLDGSTKDWLYLQPVLFNTWGYMKCTFLEKFFLASRTTSIRKEICGIRQHIGETLHEYWERFNKLYATYPHHRISEQLLIQYFYEGLSMMDKSMIDAASGGALMDKTSAAARHLISNMASNTEQFGIRRPSQSRMRLENQLTELTSLVRQLAVRQHQPALVAKVCGLCTSVEHPTDMCPTLQETESDQPKNVGAIATWETANSARTESGAIRSSIIRIHTEHLSKSNRLSTANSAISSTTFLTAIAVVESAYPRQLSISGRPIEAACNQQPGVPTICELQ